MFNVDRRAGCFSSDNPPLPGQGAGGSVVGTWNGDFLGQSVTNANNTEFFALQGQRLIMVDNNSVVYSGNYEPIGNTQFIATNVRRFNPGNDATPGSLNIDGTLRSDNVVGQLLDVRVSEVGGFGVPDNIQLVADPENQLGAGLERLSGTWMFQQNLQRVHVLNINEQGQFTGGVLSADCSYSGSAAVPDPERNLYTVNFTAIGTGCSRAGAFTGFAALYNNNVQMRVAVAGNNGAEYLPLALQ